MKIKAVLVASILLLMSVSSAHALLMVNLSAESSLTIEFRDASGQPLSTQPSDLCAEFINILDSEDFISPSVSGFHTFRSLGSVQPNLPHGGCQWSNDGTARFEGTIEGTAIPSSSGDSSQGYVDNRFFVAIGGTSSSSDYFVDVTLDYSYRLEASDDLGNVGNYHANYQLELFGENSSKLGVQVDDISFARYDQILAPAFSNIAVGSDQFMWTTYLEAGGFMTINQQTMFETRFDAFAPNIPVPATIWLFGIALIGLIWPIKNRKAA